MRCRTQAVKSLAESIFMKRFLNMIIQSLLAVLLGAAKTVSCAGLKKTCNRRSFAVIPGDETDCFFCPTEKT